MDYVRYRYPSEMNFEEVFQTEAAARACFSNVKHCFGIHLAKLSWLAASGRNPEPARYLRPKADDDEGVVIRHWHEQTINKDRLPSGWSDSLLRSWIMDERTPRVGALVNARRLERESYAWTNSLSLWVQYAPYVPFWIYYGPVASLELNPPLVSYAYKVGPSPSQRLAMRSGAWGNSPERLPVASSSSSSAASPDESADIGLRLPTRPYTADEAKRWVALRLAQGEKIKAASSERDRQLMERREREFADPNRIPTGKKDPTTFEWREDEDEMYTRVLVGKTNRDRGIRLIWQETSAKQRVFCICGNTFEVCPFMDPDFVFDDSDDEFYDPVRDSEIRRDDWTRRYGGDSAAPTTIAPPPPASTETRAPTTTTLKCITLSVTTPPRSSRSFTWVRSRLGA